MCGSYLAILLSLAAGAIYVVVQTLYAQTTRVHLTVKDLPSLTLIHITDLHGRIRFLNGSLHRLLNRWRPDMVFVTGDLAQNSGQLAYVMDEIARVRAKRGIYFVPGNYEREEMRGAEDSLSSQRTYPKAQSMHLRFCF
ncbi:metallophosphoesterase [Brevibacillus choshinensis]|uniref:Metallophosphoesterase n=1 Tax=Brevibacillus choshinensis TaxID=54911 RepID=A0ABX7FMF7_BRECH|nr:metallophosphoesterase [Brevibacillus choshinensis]QRG66837.1 metallophosphoesterase [Brevibacillus choshinensis]